MKKKLLAIASLVLVGIFALSLSENDQAANNKTLRVGTEGTYAPFSYRNDKDKLVGYDVDVARAVAKEMGYKVKFVEAPWDSMLAAFDAGKSDVVFNQASITPERKKKYAFSTPYTVSHAALIVNKDNKDIKDFSDLKGKNSAQSLTSNYATMAEDEGATIVSVDGFSKAAELVNSGRADATLNDDVVYYDYVKQQDDDSLKIVATSKEETKMAAMVQKDDKALLKKINKAMKKLKDNGTLSELSEKYFDKDISK